MGLLDPSYEYGIEAARRWDLHESLIKDPECITLEVARCRMNPSYFVNNWAFTYDPRVNPKHFPFVLYDFQRDAMRWLDERYENKELGLIEKSRDMGVTWLIAAWTVHRWLFDSGFKALFGSRKEDLVDNFSIDSIFGKVRYIINNLPTFLRPDIGTKSEFNKHLMITNPYNGNAITGESANVGFGRGGRSSITFLDEFAHIPHSEAVWASVADNSDCTIPLSTPNGKGNQFAWLRHESSAKILSLHWSKHPKKDQAWYEKRCAEMLPHQIAQELDLSYENSVAGKVYKRFERKWHIADEVIYHNPEYEQCFTMDFGIADPTAIINIQITTEGEIEIYNAFELTDEDIDFYIPIMRGYKPSGYDRKTPQVKRVIDNALKKIPQNFKPDHYYGDNSGVARTSNSKRSCKNAMREHGMLLETSGKQTHDWRFTCLDNLLKLRYSDSNEEWYSIFRVSPDCTKVIDAFNNYEWDESPSGAIDGKMKPKHNWASHIMSALEFFAINRYPVTRNVETYREERVR